MNIRLRYRLEAVAVFLLSVFCFRGVGDDLLFRIFQTRDLERAEAIARGSVILWGPEMSGGGHLPGPLYYYLLAPAFWLGLGWWGACLIMIGFAGLTAALVWSCARKYISLSAAILAISLLLGSSWFYSTQADFLNSSWLPPFAVVAISALYWIFADVDPRKRLAWSLFFTSVAMGSQLHLHILLLVPAAIILHLSARKLNLRPVHLSELWPGLAFGFSVYLPYIIFVLSSRLGHSLGEPVLNYTGHVNSVPSYLVDRGFSEFQSVVGHGPIATAILRYFAIIGNVLFAPSLFGAGALLVGLERYRPPNLSSLSHTRMLKVTIVLLLVLLLPSTFLAIVGARTRYCLTGFIAGLFFWGLLFEKLRPCLRSLAPWRVTTLVAGLFATCVFFPWPILKKAELDASDLKAIARAVYERTCWTYDQARRRLFIIGSSSSMSIKPIYESTIAKSTPLPVLDSPSGFFVLYLRNGPVYDIHRRVQKQVEHSIAQGIEQGKIELGPVQVTSPQSAIVPYVIRDLYAYPPYINNRSEEYGTTQIERASELVRNSDSTWTARFFFCEEKFPECLVAIQVRETNPGARTYTTEVAGLPVALFSRWIAPDYSILLVEPYVEFQCEEGEDKITLAFQLGGDIRHPPRGSKVRTSGLFAPYVRDLKLASCRGRVQSIHIGYRNAIRSSGFTMGRLGPGRITFANFKENL